jgi:hypothetical protein
MELLCFDDFTAQSSLYSQQNKDFAPKVGVGVGSALASDQRVCRVSYPWRAFVLAPRVRDLELQPAFNMRRMNRPKKLRAKS